MPRKAQENKKVVLAEQSVEQATEQVKKVEEVKDHKHSEVKNNKDVKNESKVPWWWMRNDKGTQSVSVTFASVSFLVTTVIYLGSAFEKIGTVTLRPFDVSAAMAYFIPALSLYFGRRLTDAKYNVSQKNDNA